MNMDFIQHIVNKFTTFEVMDVVEMLILIAVLMFIYTYSAQHNGKFFPTLCIILSIITFLVTLFGDKHYSIGMLVTILTLQLLSFIIFFRNELRRDIFKVSLKGPLALFDTSHKKVMTQEEIDESISQIAKACQNMSKSETGALIVIAEDEIYDYIIESGTIVNAKISSELLETIFFPKSPLHDGAVVVRGGKILAAGCYLPLSQDNTLPKEFGTRHRAAVGLTESHPTLTAIVVSEETGIMTAMTDKKFKRYLDSKALTQALKIAYKVAGDGAKEAFWGGVEENAE